MAPQDENASVLIVSAIKDAFTTEQVMRITGISRRRLNYWLEKGVITAEMDMARGRGRVRLWSFTNLVELKAALWLREHLSLQLLEEVVTALRRRGVAFPLADCKVAVTTGARARQVLVASADGSVEEAISGQLVMELVVPLSTFGAELTHQIERDRKRRRLPGKIEQHRGRLGGAPVFAGTRVPVAAVQRLKKAGWSNAAILADYPGLTPADLEAVQAG